MKVELREIHKRFGKVHANAGISLNIPSGTIQGILGENGAGKSTLMKILSGYFHADSGEIILDGKPVTISFPADALTYGIGMLHQDPLDFRPMRVIDNFLLRPSGDFFPNRKHAAQDITLLMKEFGFSLDPDSYVDSLTVGERQQLEIMRLLFLGAPGSRRRSCTRMAATWWGYSTLKYVFDLREEDRYWCAADPGWITGHSYIVYGPLLNGATSFMYEGAPTYPYPNRWWQMIEKYGINILYTAPTAIRGLMRFGEAWPNRHDLSSLRLLGSVGEPINPEAWKWYHWGIGKGRCPIMDTWWQTETGMFMITPMPSVPLKPGSGTRPFPGVKMEVVSEEGKPVGPNEEGYLTILTPWPAMMPGLYRTPSATSSSTGRPTPGSTSPATRPASTRMATSG